MLFAGARRMKRFGVHVRDGFIEVVALGGSAAVSLSNADISFGSDAVELRSGLKRIQLKRNVYRQFDALKAELMRQSKASESQSDK